MRLSLTTDEDRWALLHRLNNAFIGELEVCFCCGTFLSLVLQQQQSDALRWQIGVLEVRCKDAHSANIDHDQARFLRSDDIRHLELYDVCQ